MSEALRDDEKFFSTKTVTIDALYYRNGGQDQDTPALTPAM